jgi:anthranilate synthase component 2
MTASLLVIDNYDSFTFNLVQMFRRYPLEISVHRADRISVDEVTQARPDYILISPGPKDPAAAGISLALIQEHYSRTPIFGVCLGMQCINEAFGGITVRAPLPMHGKTCPVQHEQRGLFDAVPNPLRVARYHSLAVEQINPELEVTARASDGVVMGLSHRVHPLHGVQFHPESFLTESGTVIVENFLRTGPLRKVLQ